MWKAAAGTQIKLGDQQDNDDDWETDPDFVNDVSEQEQRWGSTTIEGSGRTAGAIDMDKLRRETEQSDTQKKKQALIDGPNSSFGYGGKFGIEKDRMDKSALGHDHIEKLQQHASQKDHSTGFGGKFGVQTDRVDKSAMSWDHKEKVEKHTSQKDYVTGFGGKFGVQSDRQDKSAVGWDHVEKVNKHESQKDYSVGFGGKFGVQKDRQDKSAVGWDHHEAPQKHESQTDHKIGFGGKFGVQKDRMDKSAVTFADEPQRVGTAYDRVKPDIGAAKPSEMRAKFETMSSHDDSKPASQTGSPAPRKSVHAKAGMFSGKPEEAATSSPERMAPRQLDQSKTAFLKQTVQPEGPGAAEKAPGQLDKNKLNSQFTEQSQTVLDEPSNRNKIKEEIENLKRTQAVAPPVKAEKLEPVHKVEPVQKVEPMQKMEPVHKVENIEKVERVEKVAKVEVPAEVKQDDNESQDVYEEVFDEADQAAADVQEDEIVDTGLTAVALYDYQAAADDEISFDPEDLITHVEMIDEGWWRGLCKGRYGLFPANYVQLHQR